MFIVFSLYCTVLLGWIQNPGVGSGESGFDCANNTFMISGGTMIGLGEQTSRPSSLNSQNSLIYKGALETGSTILLTDNSGKELFAFKLPAGINSTTTLISLPEMTDGTGYKLIGNATFAGDNFNGYYSAPEIYGGTLISEFNVSSPVTDLQ